MTGELEQLREAAHYANGVAELATKHRNEAEASLASAVECLRDIAAMGRKAGSETAKNWLYRHGYPLEEGGYVPGRGYL